MVLQVEVKIDVMTSSSTVPFLVSGKQKVSFNFFCMMPLKPQCSLWFLHEQASLGLERHIRCCMGHLICSVELLESVQTRKALWNLFEWLKCIQGSCLLLSAKDKQSNVNCFIEIHLLFNKVNACCD